MNKYLYHGYTISWLLDCGADKSWMLEQDFVDMMIQHSLEGICSVNYTTSSELPNATSIEFFVQQVLTIAHVGVSMNLTRR
jgi:hypothetical protein